MIKYVFDFFITHNMSSSGFRIPLDGPNPNCHWAQGRLISAILLYSPAHLEVGQ